MDSTAVSWCSQMVSDDPNFTYEYDNEFNLPGPFDEDLFALLGQESEESLSPSSTLIDIIPSSNSIGYSPEKSFEPQLKMQKTNNHYSGRTVTSTPIILNFGNPNLDHENQNSKSSDEEDVACEFLKSKDSEYQPTKHTKKRVRPPSQTYEHTIAERKRREQLSQRFLTLSTIVPGLKKTDKTSVLEDTIKYLQCLQERVQILEEKTTDKTIGSVMVMKKSQVIVEDEDEDEDRGENEKNPNRESLPQIEARICNTQILIKVKCGNQKGILEKLINKVEKLNLSIVNATIATFGSLALEVTIITEIEKGFNLTINEVVRTLHAALRSSL